MSDTNAEYMDYIYSMLRKNEVIATDKMDKSDDMYNQYANEKISLSEFLIYAISQTGLIWKCLMSEMIITAQRKFIRR